MQQIEQLVRQAVRNGEQLNYIRQRVLDGVMNAALVRNYGSMTKAAAELGMSRHTISRRSHNRAAPIHSELTYREAWHHVSRVAFDEAFKMCDSKRAAMRHLGSNAFTLWRYGK